MNLNELIKSYSFKKSIFNFIKIVLMIILMIYFIFPIVFMLVSSLKPEELVARDMTSLYAFVLRQISMQNYIDVFNEMPFLRFLFNSILIVGLIVSAIYVWFYIDFPTWYKIVLEINFAAGFLFMSSFLVTSFQQYRNYMEVQEFQNDIENQNMKGGIE